MSPGIPNLPPLVALRAFHTVGLTGSVRRAGEALGISHTVVSRHVRNLERALGTRLVQSAGRGLVLTPAGRQFLAQVSGPLSAIAEAADDLRSRGRSLLIRCVPGFANLRLLPRLPELQRLLPQHEVRLEPRLSRKHFDTVEADIEIVFLAALPPSTQLRSERLATPRMFPVLSAELHARQCIRGVDDLMRFPLLHDESMEPWRFWLRAMQFDRAPHGPCLGTAHLALEAARLGQGVALANALLVEDDLQSRRLIEPFPSNIHHKHYHVLADRDRWDDAATRLVRDWLHTICAPRIGASDAPMMMK